MRLTLAILSLYAFLLQGMLGLAAPGDRLVAARCQHQDAPASPGGGHKAHDDDSTCCLVSCRIPIAALAPPSTALPTRHASQATPERALALVAPFIPPATAERARDPPATA